MILWSEQYEKADVDPENNQETSTTEADADLHAARALARKVLKTNHIGISSIRVQDLSQNDWLATTDVEWMAPGEEMIEIPDPKTTFICSQH